jgi:hypothetical protein
MQTFDFQSKEINQASTVPTKTGGAIVITPSSPLRTRKFYFYSEANLASQSANFIIRQFISFYYGGEFQGRIPCDIGTITSSTTNKSLECAFSAGGTVGENSILYTPQQGYITATKTVQILQPVLITAQIDRAQLDIEDVVGASITGYRAYLACLSTP